MLGITEGANHIGLNDMTVAASIIELNNITLPCILHWNQNHFVVLYKIKKGKKFYIADPAKGLVTYTLEPTPAFYSNKDFVEENKKRPLVHLIKIDNKIYIPTDFQQKCRSSVGLLFPKRNHTSSIDLQMVKS